MVPSTSAQPDVGGPAILSQEHDAARAVLADPDRLAALRATGLLDSEAEEAFDRLTRLAVRLVRVPAAFVSLVDETRDFYKSACGFGEPLSTTRELAGPTFCHHTVRRTTPLVVPDTAADPAWRTIPTVQTLGVAAYVGVPLLADGQTIGAFCAIDTRPRAWTDDEIAVLTELAASAQREMELRAVVSTAQRTAAGLEAQRSALGAAYEQLKAQRAELEASYQQLQEQQTEFEAQAEALQEANANLEGALGDAVRARRQADQARGDVQRAHARTVSVLESMSDAYFALDAELRVVAVNGAMERSAGLSRDTLVGADFLTLFPGAVGTDFERHYRRAAIERVGIERIQKSQRHLLGLINGVLNCAKVDAGAAHYDIGVVPVAEVLTTCETLVVPQLRAKRLGFDPGGCDPALHVRADREKMQQVLLNLLSNAVKFSGVGGRISIRCAVRSTRRSRGRSRAPGWGWRSAATSPARWAAT